MKSVANRSFQFDDEVFFLYHFQDAEEEINQKLGLLNCEYVYFY
jgi:hypothetical protein